MLGEARATFVWFSLAGSTPILRFGRDGENGLRDLQGHYSLFLNGLRLLLPFGHNLAQALR